MTAQVPAPAPIRVPAPVPLPGQWTFWADTIVGQVPLGPVSPTGFSCTWRLSGFGNGEVTLPASSPVGQDRMLRLWSWRLWAWWGGRPVWCGVPSGIRDEGRASVTLTLTELPGYLQKRVLEAAYSPVQVEQTEIGRYLAAPVADVGVRVVTDPGPGFLRDRAYEMLEGQNRAELLSNLAGVISGPQFRSEYALAGAVPDCALRIAYPRVGGDSGLGVMVPGRAADYSAAWDSDAMRTHTFAVGDLPEDAPEGAQKPVAVEDRPQPDLPRLDAVDDWPSTILLSTLRERAAQMATANAAPALQLSATARDNLPPLGSYGVGDTVTVRITSPLLAGGLDVAGVLTEMTASAGEGTVNWQVSTGSPPPTPRPTLNQRLNRLDYVTAGVFRRNLTIV
jgi:hypothetical protein